MTFYIVNCKLFLIMNLNTSVIKQLIEVEKAYDFI